MNLGELFVKIGAQLKGFDEAMGKVEKKLQSTAEKLQRAGVGLSLAISAPLGALAAGAIRASIGFETAMAAVRKNVDGTEESLQNLAHGIEDLSTRIPATTKQIAAVASAAGQLGIANENILSFTETMIALGETTNLSADQAAVALAQIATVTQMPQDQFDRLASTILKLGKTSNTTEAQITEMAVRIAGAGSQIGMAQSEILAFATATASVGVEAEAGGTALSQVFIEIAKSVEMGGQRLEEFASVAQMSGEEFASTFRKNAADAVLAFVEGLGQLKQEGRSTFQVIEELGLDAARMTRVLLSLSGAGDQLRKSLALGRREWEQNITLTETVNRAYSTTGSQLSMFRNRIEIAAARLGDALIPMLKDLMGVGTSVIRVLEKMARGFGEWGEGSRKVVAALGLVAIAAGPVLLALSGLVRGVQALTIASSFLARHPVVSLATALVGLVHVVALFTVGGAKASAQTTTLSEQLGKGATQAERFAAKAKDLAAVLEQLGSREAGIQSEIQALEARMLAITQAVKDGNLQWQEFDKQSQEIQTRLKGLRGELQSVADAQAAASDEAAGAKGDAIFAGMNARLATINKTFKVNVERMGEAKATQRKLAEESALYEATLQELLQVLPEYDSRVLAVKDGLLEVDRAQEDVNASTAEAVQVVAGADKAYKELAATLDAIGLTGRVFGDELGAARAQIRETETAIADLIQKGKAQGLSDEAILNDEGVQKSVAALETLRQKYTELSFTHQDFARSFTETWEELGSQLQVTGQEVATLLFDTFNSLAQGIGATVAKALFYGQEFKEGILDVLKQVGAAVVTQLITLGIQELAFLILGVGSAAKRTSAQVAGFAATAAAAAGAAVAIAAAELGLAGLALLPTIPAVAAAAGAGVTAAATAAGVAGAAVGTTIPALAEGGITKGPTVALVGEAGTEVVSPLDDLLAMIQEAMRGILIGPNTAAALEEDSMETSALAGLVRGFHPQPLDVTLHATLVAERRAIARMVLEEIPIVLQKKLGNAFG